MLPVYGLTNDPDGAWASLWSTDGGAGAGRAAAGAGSAGATDDGEKSVANGPSALPTAPATFESAPEIDDQIDPTAPVLATTGCPVTDVETAACAAWPLAASHRRPPPAAIHRSVRSRPRPRPDRLLERRLLVRLRLTGTSARRAPAPDR